MKLIVFPELRQMYNYDCGANELQQILCYYGFHIREEYLIDMLDTKPTTIRNIGTNTAAIKKVAEDLGLPTEIKTMTVEDLIESIDNDIPVMVLLQAYTDKENVDYATDYDDGHYVGAIGYDEENIYFDDPSSFFRTYLSFEELDKRWHAVGDDNKGKLEHCGIVITGTPDYDPNETDHME